ncbi:hypothetical protein DPEC_G00242830 [Dallia pectoralis]|uniref:Uncharacterized protein n=1 Tax=Dallia pectoralis TaxID=75939 RepID=A0ACC2FV44_DALPE|nr:hypothetical protein DPEC_G00242830 [Dallia pectoralis]
MVSAGASSPPPPPRRTGPEENQSHLECGSSHHAINKIGHRESWEPVEGSDSRGHSGLVSLGYEHSSVPKISTAYMTPRNAQPPLPVST